MESYKLHKRDIELHHIIIAMTTEIDYEMCRYLLVEGLDDLDYNEYLIIEGGHCSCYDFDDTVWDAIKYKKEELIKLARKKVKEYNYYKIENMFYKHILEYFGEEIEEDK